MTIKDLENNVDFAKEYGYAFIAVRIEMEGFNEPEIIINPKENFDAKLAYYKKAYNDNLTLKSFNGIKITGFTYANDYEEIENELYHVLK